MVAKGRQRQVPICHTVTDMEEPEALSTSAEIKINKGKVLIVEPFYGGSHRQLVDCLLDGVSDCVAFTLPAKKWHWRARTSALYFAETIPVIHDGKGLFCSSVLNLAELVALRPDLGHLHKVIYFHENQLVYPVRKHQDRDFQYGYNQILSCLVADVVVFNSKYNMNSFLDSIKGFLKLIPDHRPRGLRDKIAPKCRVIYFPLKFPDKCILGHVEQMQGTTVPEMNCQQKSDIDNNCLSCSERIEEPKSKEVDVDSSEGHFINSFSTKEIISKEKLQHDQDSTLKCDHDTSKHIAPIVHGNGEALAIGSKFAHIRRNRPLHIVWPHRWEHDKDPETFFHTLHQLQEEGCHFRVSVLGEGFTDVPDIFEKSKERLKEHIVHWGYQPSKSDYLEALAQSDVVVSTAKHEFFGVAMLEAVYMGCFPICPNSLVYPEIFPVECLYNTSNQLIKKLRQFCRRPDLSRGKVPKVDLEQFSWETLAPVYRELLHPPGPSDKMS